MNSNTVTKSCVECQQPSEGIRCETCFENQLVGRFTIGQLRAAFNVVAKPTDWKAPINALIPSSEKRITEDAIAFFTGTTVTFKKASGGRVRVMALGYRSGPAGDK